MQLIGVAGKIGSGKDTFAEMIKVRQIDNAFPEWMTIEEKIAMVDNLKNRKSNWEIKKFAGKIKEIGTILTGITDWEDRTVKETPIMGWGMTRREFMQRLGTEAIRDGLHKDAWVMALMSEYNSNKNWIITDVRFPNEAKAIKDNGGVMIMITRPGFGGDKHASETSLNDYVFDYVIQNDGDMNHLYSKVLALDFI